VLDVYKHSRGTGSVAIMSGGVAGAGSAGNPVEFDPVFDDAREQVAGLGKKRDRLKRALEAVEAEVGAERAQTSDDMRQRQQAFDDAQRAVKDTQDKLDEAQLRLFHGRRNQETLERCARARLAASQGSLQRADDAASAAEAALAELEAAEKEEKALAMKAEAAVAPVPVVEAVECPVCFEDMPLAERFKFDPCNHEVCETCVNRLLFAGHLVCMLCRKPIRFFDPVVPRLS
jgi:hypothetical protein